MKSDIYKVKNIGLQAKLLSSCQAFSQSHRQTNVVTFSGKRAARVLLTMYPEELNSHSHGTGVAGIHNTKFAKTGKRFRNLIEFKSITQKLIKQFL